MLRYFLCLIAIMMPGSTQAAWQIATSKHFVVYADVDPNDIATFTTTLELDDKVLRAMHGLDDPPISHSNRATIFVVRNVDAVHKLLGHGSDRVAGIFFPRAAGSIIFTPAEDDGYGKFKLHAQEILLHEYAHHFMFSNFPDTPYPAWMIEGFAEFHATTKIEGDGSATIGLPPQYRSYGILQRHKLPIMVLLTGTPYDSDPEIFYGRSWLLTHYLMLEPQRRKAFSTYIASLDKGADPHVAAAAFGDPSTLDRHLDDYAMSKLAVLSIPADRLTIGQVNVWPLTTAEVAIMPVRMASARGVNKDTSETVAAKARDVALSYPKDAAVQDELAEAEYDATNYDAARIAAERAYVADPASVHAMIYQGLARMASAGKSKSSNPAEWQTIREWYTKANKADPEYAWPLQLYYESYIKQGVAAPPTAQNAILYARVLAPFEVPIATEAAYIYLKRGDIAAATHALERISSDPHGGTQAIATRTIITIIKKQGASAAITAIEKAMTEKPKVD